MATASVRGSGFEIAAKQDPLFFESQFPSFDFRSDSIACESGYWQNDSFIGAENFLPLDPLYASLDIEQSPSMIPEDMNGVNSVWNELGPLFEPNREMLLICDSSRSGQLREEKKVKKWKEEKIKNNSISKALSRQIISKYFYMPITQAAKELNVGLTLLKKRCRELGIRRWPHRKLMSIQTLIKNMQESKKFGGEESEGKLKEALEILERERKLLEEMPDMQLEHTTKRLRQACFKANYKKRKFLGSTSTSSCSLSSLDPIVAASEGEEATGGDARYDGDDDEIKSLLNENDPSSCNSLLF